MVRGRSRKRYTRDNTIGDLQKFSAPAYYLSAKCLINPSSAQRITLGEHYGAINAANLKRAHSNIESGKAIGKIELEGFSIQLGY